MEAGELVSDEIVSALIGDELDALAPAAIAVVPIPNIGLGEAIRDRLARAAAPRG